MPVGLRESWPYQETVLKIQKLLENVCETQSLLLTYLRTLSEDGNIFWTNWWALFNSYVCFFVFTHRLWQGIVFIVINDPQKKRLAWVLFRLFVSFCFGLMAAQTALTSLIIRLSIGTVEEWVNEPFKRREEESVFIFNKVAALFLNFSLQFSTIISGIWKFIE